MCTLTWFHTDEGYELVFNRDEQRTRGPEVPATEFVHEGVRILAPRDGNFGGSWIAANEFGVTVALLNGYVESLAPEHPNPESRGRLVLALAGSSSTARLFAAARSLELERYQPFVLAAFEAGETARVARFVMHAYGARVGHATAPHALGAIVRAHVRRLS